MAPADSRNRSLSVTELQILQLKVEFLRLQPFDKQPDNIRKSDAMIVVQGRTREPVYAHRFILSGKSRVFCTMFNVKMSEEATGIIYIDDASLPVISALIKFFYDAEIDFTSEVTAEEVLRVAHKYEVPLLHKICEQHLIDTLTEGNLIKRLRYAEKFDAARLKKVAIRYFKGHFDNVIENFMAEIL